MTIHCQKTGRHWPCSSEGQARQMAASLGLKDWTWCPPNTQPPTMRETIRAMTAPTRDAVAGQLTKG